MKNRKITFIIPFFLLIIFQYSYSQGVQEVLIEDSFDDNSYQWTLGSLQFHEAAIADSKYLIQGRVSSGVMLTWSTLKKGFSNKRDFSISCNTTWIANRKIFFYGITWGTATDRYFFGISPAGTYLGERNYFGKAEKITKLKRSSHINKKGTNQLEIKKTSGKLAFLINGKVVKEVTISNDDRPNSEVGFYVSGNQKVLFDNFKVVGVEESDISFSSLDNSKNKPITPVKPSNNTRSPINKTSIQNSFEPNLVGGMWFTEFLEGISNGSVRKDREIYVSYDNYGNANFKVVDFRSTRNIRKIKSTPIYFSMQYQYEKTGIRSGKIRFYRNNELSMIGNIEWKGENSYTYTETFASGDKKHLGKKFSYKRMKGNIPKVESSSPTVPIDKTGNTTPNGHNKLYCNGCSGHGFKNCTYCTNGMAYGLTCSNCSGEGYDSCKAPPCGARQYTLSQSQVILKNVYSNNRHYIYNAPVKYFYQINSNTGIYDFFYEYNNGKIEKITQ